MGGLRKLMSRNERFAPMTGTEGSYWVGTPISQQDKSDVDTS